MSSRRIVHMAKRPPVRLMSDEWTACGCSRSRISLATRAKDATCLSCLRNRGFIAEYRKMRAKRQFKLRPVTP